MDVIVLIKAMLVLFIIMCIGYAMRKCGWLDDNAGQVMSSLIVNVTGPALVIASVCSGSAKSGSKMEIIKIFLIGIVLYAVYIVLSIILIKICRLGKSPNANIYELILIFANTGYIGYPVYRVLYGDYGIFAAAILHMPFNILIYTYAVYKMRGNKSQGEKFNFKKLINPGTISSIIAIMIFFMNIKASFVIADTASSLGNVTIPLSMILIGYSLETIPLKDVFKDIQSYIITFLRLIAMPAICFFVAKIFLKDEFLIGLITVSAALPAGSMIVMLATQYKANIKAASIGVFLTTVLSVITIPFMVYLLLT